MCKSLPNPPGDRKNACRCPDLLMEMSARPLFRTRIDL
jgi:hypothetical protein